MYRTVFWTLWEREGERIWENGIKTCRISYKKQIASPGSVQDTGSLGLVHWDDPEGWFGEGGGRGFQDGEHVYGEAGADRASRPQHLPALAPIQVKRTVKRK